MNTILEKQHYFRNKFKIIVIAFSIASLFFQSHILKGQETTKHGYTSLWEWSEPINNPNYLREPHCIRLDADGNLLIADMGASRIMRFTPKGEYLADLGNGYGSEDGYFDKPRDVAMDSKGNFVVTDQKSKKNRIQVFNSKGKFLRSFAKEGSGPGEINWPHGLAFASKGRILVTDVANRRVNLYKRSGKFIKALGQSGPNVDILTVPHSLTVDPDDGVFISDYFGTVQKFSIDGDYLFSFKNEVHTVGSAFIHTICSDQKGNVYLMVRGIKGFEGSYEESKVEDRAFYIAKYTNSGELICTIQLQNKGREIIHATVDSQGKIYALFKGDGRMGVEVLKEN